MIEGTKSINIKIAKKTIQNYYHQESLYLSNPTNGSRLLIIDDKFKIRMIKK